LPSDLSEYENDWILREQARSTLKMYLRHLRRYFGRYATLSLSQVREHLLTLDSVHERRSAARALKNFDLWFSREYEFPRTLGGLVLPKEPQPRAMRTAVPADVVALLATCVTTGDLDADFLARRDRAIILALFSSGMRRGELLAVKLTDLDTDGTILLPKTKNGDVRSVRLSSEALKALKQYLRHHHTRTSEYLWLTNRGRRLSVEGLRKMLDRRCVEAHVDLTPHSFRRGFACEWLKLGGSQVRLKTIAGWRTDAMVGRYVKANEREAALDEHRAIFK
jgi:integrase